MRITITKGQGSDNLDIARSDGSRVSTAFPHKGPIPHDFVHFAVERELGLERGFWGLVAAGHDPADIQAMAKAAGHASAQRAQRPTADFVDAIQAERTVEAFEADHWSGGDGDPEGVSAMAEAGCAQSQVPPPHLDNAAIARIRLAIAGFAERWTSLPPGQSITLQWQA